MSDLKNEHNGNNMRIVVVGNGMVGHHFVDQLIQENTAFANAGSAGNESRLDVVVLSAEPRLAYDRVHLSEYFSGKTAKELALTTPEYYQAHNIKFAVNAKVVNINKIAKSVTTEAGKVFEYDKLVLSTGSYPFVPPISGNDQPHCLVYRTIEVLNHVPPTSTNL